MPRRTSTGPSGPAGFCLGKAGAFDGPQNIEQDVLDVLDPDPDGVEHLLSERADT